MSPSIRMPTHMPMRLQEDLLELAVRNNLYKKKAVTFLTRDHLLRLLRTCGAISGDEDEGDDDDDDDEMEPAQDSERDTVGAGRDVIERARRSVSPRSHRSPARVSGLSARTVRARAHSLCRAHASTHARTHARTRSLLAVAVSAVSAAWCIMPCGSLRRRLVCWGPSSPRHACLLMQISARMVHIPFGKTCTRTCVHTCRYTYRGRSYCGAHSCPCTCLYRCMHMSMHLSVHTSMHLSVYMPLYVSMRMCVRSPSHAMSCISRKRVMHGAHAHYWMHAQQTP